MLVSKNSHDIKQRSRARTKGGTQRGAARVQAQDHACAPDAARRPERSHHKARRPREQEEGVQSTHETGICSAQPCVPRAARVEVDVPLVVQNQVFFSLLPTNPPPLPKFLNFYKF
jgi:hypothetical protein